MHAPTKDSNLRVVPLEPDGWEDFEQLFGPHGAYAGCWCMWWRIPRREFAQGQGEFNRLAMKQLVESGRTPGVLGYLHGQPVAWCCVAPRSDFGSLNRSPVLRAIDDLPVWSIVCFFIDKCQRGRGLMLDLLVGVKAYVGRAGGSWLEAYPTIPKSKNDPPVSSFMGSPSVFRQAGFVEVARPSPSKMIMRCPIDHA